MKLIIHYDATELAPMQYFDIYDMCFLLDRILYQYIFSNCFTEIVLSSKKYNPILSYYISNHTLFRKYITCEYSKVNMDGCTNVEFNYLYNIDNTLFKKLVQTAQETQKNIIFPGGSININTNTLNESIKVDIENIKFENEEDIRLGKITYTRWCYKDAEGDD